MKRDGLLAAAVVCFSFVLGAPDAFASDPIGHLDGAGPLAGAGANGFIWIHGWTIDQDTPKQPTTVHVYVDGPAGSGSGTNTGLADLTRRDVAHAYPGAGRHHGFSTITAGSYPPGPHSVYVYAINTSPGNNPLIGSTTVTLPPNRTGTPLGSLDLVRSRRKRRLSVAGWTFDPSAKHKHPRVAIYVDGPREKGRAGGHRHNIGRARKRRRDVAHAYPGVGSHHGFSRTIKVKPGPHVIYAYALDAAGKGRNAVLGARRVVVRRHNPPTVLGSPDYITPTGLGWGHQHPRRVFNGGDPGGAMWKIRWHHWGRRVAKGSGRVAINRPEGGYYHLIRVPIRARHIGHCAGFKHRAYLQLQLRVPVWPGGPLGSWHLWNADKNLCRYADGGVAHQAGVCGHIGRDFGFKPGGVYRIQSYRVKCKRTRAIARRSQRRVHSRCVRGCSRRVGSFTCHWLKLRKAEVEFGHQIQRTACRNGRHTMSWLRTLGAPKRRLSARGWGSIRMGDSPRTVRRKYVAELDCFKLDGRCVCESPPAGEPHPVFFAFGVGGPRAHGLDVIVGNSRKVRTTRGVGVGDRLSHFARRYPNAHRSHRLGYTSYLARQGKYGILAEGTNGRITGLIAGRSSVLNYDEFCG